MVYDDLKEYINQNIFYVWPKCLTLLLLFFKIVKNLTKGFFFSKLSSKCRLTFCDAPFSRPLSHKALFPVGSSSTSSLTSPGSLICGNKQIQGYLLPDLWKKNQMLRYLSIHMKNLTAFHHKRFICINLSLNYIN